MSVEISNHHGRGRRVAIMLHPTRPDATAAAAEFVQGVDRYGITCCFLPEQLAVMSQRLPEIGLEPIGTRRGGIELVVVFGGDGTVLRSAEWALPHEVPLLGVNLGHVGFLAEMDVSEIGELIEHVAYRRYQIERRLTLAVELFDPSGERFWGSFAVNEVSVEKASRQKMVDLLVSIDGRPLSRWACDGVLVSTASGSTAYGFSAGGPVIWPDVEAFEVCPIAAHALFAHPIVVAPNSLVELYAIGDELDAVVWCDGRRSVEVPAGSRVSVQRCAKDLRIARLSEQPFTTRLVKKFELNIDGWRNNAPVRGGATG